MGDFETKPRKSIVFGKYRGCPQVQSVSWTNSGTAIELLPIVPPASGRRESVFLPGWVIIILTSQHIHQVIVAMPSNTYYIYIYVHMMQPSQVPPLPPKGMGI